MTEMAARYDRRSRSYGRCWAPILAPSAIALLDAVAPALGVEPTATVLDAGTGSGTLALAAVRRWAGVRVIGLDVSAGMLAVADREAAALRADDRARLSLVEGSIAAPDDAGLAPGSIDVAISSFVLQLVPDRSAAFAGLRRILRSGGVLAFLVWAQEAKPWAAEAAFDIALQAAFARAGVPPPTPAGCPRAGPIASAEAACAELRASGFADAEAWEPVLHHAFERDEARALFVDYDRAADLDAMSPHMRAAVIDSFDAQLASLPDAAFSWDAPLVAARAVRPPGP